MPLVDKIQKDMYKAMKEKEKERINALRNIIGKLKYRYIDKGDKLTEQEEIKVIQSLAKQRRESIEMYKQGGRNDLVETGNRLKCISRVVGMILLKQKRRNYLL